MRIFCFLQRVTGAKRDFMAMKLWMSFGFFCDTCTFLMLSLKNTALLFPEIFFIQYFTLFITTILQNAK